MQKLRKIRPPDRTLVIRVPELIELNVTYQNLALLFPSPKLVSKQKYSKYPLRYELQSSVRGMTVHIIRAKCGAPNVGPWIVSVLGHSLKNVTYQNVAQMLSFPKLAHDPHCYENWLRYDIGK
jgi:hypothetical protein